MDIYIDVFFLINFFIDYAVLTVADIKKITKRKRRIFSSFLAGIISCIIIIYPSYFYFSIGFKLAFLFFMTAVAVLPTDFKKYISYTSSVFISSLFLLTGVFLLEIFTKQNGALYFFYTSSDKILLFGISIGYLLFKFIKNTFKINQDRVFFNLEIKYNKKTVKIKALRDTGNLLKSPFSSMPVIVTDKSVFEKLFFKNIKAEELRELVDPMDFKVIPYKTISENGIIYGFRPHLLKIDGRIEENVIIGYAPMKLTEEALINV